eukprot:1753798-Rhodomonas_salina.2
MPSYKDHPVPELKGDPVDSDETIFLHPTLAQYDKWLHTVCKVLRAIGILWLVPMALGLEFEQGEYLPIVPGNVDDADDPLFQYVVVAMAIAEGSLQHLPETENALFNRVNCQKNYQFICTAITGLSAQLLAKCATTFPNVFSFIDVHAKPHLLAGLRELADIHSIYQLDGASVNSATAWRTTFSAIRKKVEPDTQSITDWINGVAKAVQALNNVRVATDAINGAVCGNVIDVLGSFEDLSSMTASLWLSRADALRTRNENEAISWSELFDDIHSFLASDARQEEQEATNDSGVGKKRKAPSGSSAPIYYTMDEAMHKIAAYFSATAGHSAPRCPASGGGRTEEAAGLSESCLQSPSPWRHSIVPSLRPDE